MISFEYAKSYCKDDISLIENYDKAISDKNQIWQCHHRRENISSRKELIENNEYYNRPANELIFLTPFEHTALHNKNKYVSSETRKKMSIAKQGNKYRLGIRLSDEHKQKIGEYSKMSHWFNNGITEVFVKECPAGFVKGRLKKVKQS